MSRSFLSVSEFSSILKSGIESLFPYPIQVKGEISNLKVYPSGHGYFSLKDEKAMVSCVMWASQIEKMALLGKRLPKDGDSVIATARVTVYPGRGQYQLNCLSLEPFGLGDALLRLEELKKKLSAEGLFDESKKLPIPRFPSLIGVIAGSGSAGLKDILTNLANRWPIAKILVFPSLVQGADAPKSLLEALNKAINAKVDTLIIGRGGGSSEDLGAFNDETLVRAVAACRIPVISAVGHEIDTTLLDYVSDKRVSTPTGAAIAAVPDQYEILQDLITAEERMQNALTSRLVALEKALESLASRPVLEKAENIYGQKEKDIEELSKRLKTACLHAFALENEKISALKGRLDALDPHQVLNRGYTITLDEKGIPFNSVETLSVGDHLTTLAKDGKVVSVVTGKEKNHG